MDVDYLPNALQNIELEDLEYVERDLSFGELASIALLLYGEERTTAEFALQKLMVMSNSQNANQASPTESAVPRDLLRTYALTINRTNWRPHIVEALAIINARRVLRKLGFNWEKVRQHYLPHVTEISLHLHPLIKSLHRICESLTPAQAGRLILYMDEHHRPQDHFRFYNSEVLEVFMLDWITRRIISVGDRKTNGSNLQILFEYFKLTELEDMKLILIDTLESISNGTQNMDSAANASVVVKSPQPALDSTLYQPNANCNGVVQTQPQEFDKTENGNTKISDDRYTVNFESAGFALIINEREFYAETDAQLQHLLPKDIPKIRSGTDVDKDKLAETFTSFGYKVIVKENLTNYQMLDTIDQFAKRSLLYDSFVVCILSHGFEGHVYGSNSIPVAIAEIEEKFTVDELANKPKLLIIQACQSKNMDLSEKRRKNTCPQEYADILRAMATVTGFPSLRHSIEGSWFIQHLCSAMLRLSHEKHLPDILTAVTAEVANKKGDKANEVMVPQVITTLRKYFYLPLRKTN